MYSMTQFQINVFILWQVVDVERSVESTVKSEVLLTQLLSLMFFVKSTAELSCKTILLLFSWLLERISIFLDVH